MAGQGPYDQLGSDPAAHRRQHRPGDGVHVRQETGQLHLAGMPCRSQLASCGLTLCRITPAGRQYTIAMFAIVVPVRIWWQPAATPSKLRARSGMTVCSLGRIEAGYGWARIRVS